MCFSSPKIPAATPPPASAGPVTEQDQAVQAALDRERQRQAARLGKRSTMLTGNAGLSTPPPSAPKTMLGQ